MLFTPIIQVLYLVSNCIECIIESGVLWFDFLNVVNKKNGTHNWNYKRINLKGTLTLLAA